MAAKAILDRRVVLDEDLFVEMVVWELPKAAKGSRHRFKYRLALLFRGECVVRYDNEVGKGDHRHVEGVETEVRFTGVDRLLADFRSDVERWKNAHRHA